MVDYSINPYGTKQFIIITTRREPSLSGVAKLFKLQS